jgi:hypothetical protein
MDPAQAETAVRAFKTVALANGVVHETEAALLRAAAAALGVSTPLEALTPIEPDDAARSITDPPGRTRLIEGMMLMALMDQRVDAPELAVIDRFARALGVDEPRVKNLHQFVDGAFTRLKLDVARRSYFAQHVATEAWKHDGLVGVWKAFAPRVGLGTDPELAWRYKQLGLLPEGTLGRLYWTHCTSRRLDLPGEARGFAWQAVHDFGHVLGNHDTDPAGEIEQAAFEAGYMRRDPFFLIFATTMIFHLGFPVLGDDYIGHARGMFDPERAVDAYRRGLATKLDLTAWDFWPHVARPIDEVRRELGITPRA